MLVTRICSFSHNLFKSFLFQVLVTSLFSFSHYVFKSLLCQVLGVLRGSAVKQMTRNLEVLCSSSLDLMSFFAGQTFQSPKLVDLLVNSLPDDKILDRSKLKQSADDNFKFDENSRKFSTRVENTVSKGKIVRYEQFLLCPLFSKACFPGASKGGIVWEWVKTRNM